jgi:ArsR family transcriptional regulator
MTREPECCQEYAVNNDAVKEAKKNIPDENVLSVLSRTYRAFGDPNRLKILLGLSQRELCVCELGEVLEMSPPAVSHHLRLLKDLGLVRTRRAGKLVYYALDDDHVQTLLQTGLTHVAHRFNL